MNNPTRKLKIARQKLLKASRQILNQTPFKSIKTCKHQLEMQKNQSHRNRNGNQHSDTTHPCLRTDSKDQDERDVVDLNTRMTNADADHQDMVTDPSQNYQTKIDFSGNIVRAIDDFEGQTSLYVTIDKLQIW